MMDRSWLSTTCPKGLGKSLWPSRDSALQLSKVCMENTIEDWGYIPQVKRANLKLYIFTIGECFGFLGVNGAGKTTSFRMLTGDEYMTSGQASLYGVEMNSKKRRFMRMIGYCPQFDSIIEVLTGRQMLSLFAHIRGLPLSRYGVLLIVLLEAMILNAFSPTGMRLKLTNGLILLGLASTLIVSVAHTLVGTSANWM